MIAAFPNGLSCKYKNIGPTFVLANVSFLIWLLLTGRKCPPSFILRIIFICPKIVFQIKITLLIENFLFSPVKLYIFSWTIRVTNVTHVATLRCSSIRPFPIVNPTVPVKSNPWVCFTYRQVGGEADQEVVCVPVVYRGQVSIELLTLLSCLKHELFVVKAPVAVAGVRTVGPAKNALWKNLSCKMRRESIKNCWYLPREGAG